MPESISPSLVAAFTFHEVCDDPSSSGLQRRAAMPYKHTTAAFRATLDAIGASGLTPGLLEPGAERSVVLTFDDGGRSALDAARELERRGWRGYFFLVSDFIGKQGFLDEHGIRDLHSAGHGIGNHSATHPDIFRALSRQQMLSEWTHCRDRIEQIVGKACPVASVPGGDCSIAVYRAASDCGIRNLFTSAPIVRPFLSGNADHPCLVLGRANVKADTPPRLCAKLARFEGWQREHTVFVAKQMMRKALAPVYRAYVGWATKPFETTN